MRQNSLLFGLVIGAMSLTTVSCVDSSFLNETQTSDLSKEAIFSDSTYTVGFLNHIYADAGYDIYPNRFDGVYGVRAKAVCRLPVTRRSSR